MAWVRLAQTGFEFQDVNELDGITGFGATTSSISSAATANTGSYSLRIGLGRQPRGKVTTGTDKVCMQMGCALIHDGLNSNDEGIIFLVRGTNDIVVTLDQSEDLARIRVNGTDVANSTMATAGLGTVGQWNFCSIYVYRNTSNGRVLFYVNGILKLEYTGNTGSFNNAGYVGGELTLQAWELNSYVDDVYIDYSTSQEPELPPPSYKYELLRPTADGSPLTWSTFGSGTHYLNVDDPTPDSDTTYNFVTATTLVDTYTIADYDVPDGFTITSVIPTVAAKKTGAGTDPTLEIGLNENSTDAYGSAQSLTTSYAYYWDRQLAAPDTES
jgi:hypothetical protein